MYPDINPALVKDAPDAGWQESAVVIARYNDSHCGNGAAQWTKP
ncbi:hypothetical protein ARTSIC4J27_4366 [Pseudarthrobacter siccitolerans]|uniref:Uncharacterized protein n=1 Tax=Pseudarthrobacter siccitolerans TaxID=861266 RepID=A0A024H974_9MICC|nr:hypothetical protein ARTSIC4J27_4366 [Pseudarthrobacter siccitolerans]